MGALTRPQLAAVAGVNPGTVGHWDRKRLLVPLRRAHGGPDQATQYPPSETVVAQVLAQLRTLELPVASNDWLAARLGQLRAMLVDRDVPAWVVLGERSVRLADDPAGLAAAVSSLKTTAIVVALGAS